MIIPDGYKSFSSFEEKRKKYYEWGFKSRKKDELKSLYYKGTFTDDPYNNPEPCDIIGYYNDIEIIIELQNSGKKIIIDRRYLKQMQEKHFKQNQPD